MTRNVSRFPVPCTGTPSQAVLVGPCARAAFARNPRGRVLSSHATGAYCTLEDGTMLLLHDPAQGSIPFGLACAAPTGDGPGWKCLPPGTPLHNDATLSAVHIGPVSIGYGSAVTPPRRRPWTNAPPNRDNLRYGLDRAVTLLAETGHQQTEASMAAGFGRNKTALFTPAVPLIHNGDVWEDALWRATRALLTLRDEGDSGEGGGQHPVTALIGLGPGLTPLGDDILCGMFAAAHILAEPLPTARLDDLLHAAAPAALAALPGATTAQSIAFVTAAALGYGFGMLDALVLALCEGTDADLDTAISTVLAVGHSSGSGMLLGVLCAAQAALEENGDNEGAPEA